MNAAAQFRLPLQPASVWTRDSFVVSASNRAAVAALDAWSQGAMALVGPSGAGKSHLAQAWADQAGATVVLAGQPIPLDGEAPVLLEDADLGGQDEALFHLLNQAQAGRRVLLTARARPVAWATALPDLRSRLNALPVAEIEPPDADHFTAVLEALFLARHIKPQGDLYPYLLTRMERSVAAARDLVTRMDDEGAARGREINKALARELLERTPGLFED